MYADEIIREKTKGDIAHVQVWFPYRIQPDSEVDEDAADGGGWWPGLWGFPRRRGQGDGWWSARLDEDPPHLGVHLDVPDPQGKGLSAIQYYLHVHL